MVLKKVIEEKGEEEAFQGEEGIMMDLGKIIIWIEEEVEDLWLLDLEEAVVVAEALEVIEVVEEEEVDLMMTTISLLTGEEMDQESWVDPQEVVAMEDIDQEIDLLDQIMEEKEEEEEYSEE